MSEETAFAALLGMIEEPEARESLLRFQAGAGLPEDDPLFVLAFALALAVQVPGSEILREAAALVESGENLATRLESLEHGLGTEQQKLARASDSVCQAIAPLVANLNNCATVVKQVSNDNAETLKRWNEAMCAIQRAERDIVAAAVVAARAEGHKSRLGTAKIAALAGVAASAVGGPVGVLILKILGLI